MRVTLKIIIIICRNIYYKFLEKMLSIVRERIEYIEGRKEKIPLQKAREKVSREGGITSNHPLLLL